MAPKLFFNFFKHVPEDLVISSLPGMIISAIGTVILVVLFMFELRSYLSVTTQTELVVDEFVDEVLRVNFNVTLHQVPCEYLSVDVSDLTGMNTHNISKDILKWRLDANQRILAGGSTAVAVEHKHVKEAAKLAEASAALPFFDDEDEDEPSDTNLSQPLNPETFVPFMKQHELTLVNFFAPWCIWCRRLEPVYLETASKVPTLHFHGHARLAQVDCVANQNFCGKHMIRAYPTLRMYKDGNPLEFNLFTGQRTVEDLLRFVQQEMTMYKKSHNVKRKLESAAYDVMRGALVGGTDLYRAKMSISAATDYCGNNERCMGFTWQSSDKDEEEPMVFFKAGDKETDRKVNAEEGWTSHLKLRNATAPISTTGHIMHGPEGCRIAGHLQVRKVPGTLRLVLHSPHHDHEGDLINASHAVSEFWFGEPLTHRQRSHLSREDKRELASPTSHLLEGLPFTASQPGHSHVHYMKVVTRVLKHADSPVDLIAYKYTVHSNKFEASDLHVPAVEFKYDLSPISIVIHQVRTPFYRFLTSTCAIIGGVFTVIGLLENIIHTTSNRLLKKQI